MPEMNGIKLVQSIQKMNLNIKCVLMSGYPDKVFKEEGFELKKIPFLRKPFTLEQASDLIMRILL
jgi:YesN/AraC family two-component response regulator